MLTLSAPKKVGYCRLGAAASLGPRYRWTCSFWQSTNRAGTLQQALCPPESCTEILGGSHHPPAIPRKRGARMVGRESPPTRFSLVQDENRDWPEKRQHTH